MASGISLRIANPEQLREQVVRHAKENKTTITKRFKTHNIKPNSYYNFLRGVPATPRFVELLEKVVGKFDTVRVNKSKRFELLYALYDYDNIENPTIKYVSHTSDSLEELETLTKS